MINDFFQQKPRDYSPINTKYRSINSQIPVTDSNLIFEIKAEAQMKSASFRHHPCLGIVHLSRELGCGFLCCCKQRRTKISEKKTPR